MAKNDPSLLADILDRVEGREGPYRLSRMPQQKPGRSFQAYGTPRIFLDAVERRFGKLLFDLAATLDNCVVRRGGAAEYKSYFAPEADGRCAAVDSLKQDWTKLRGNIWLNPPFGHIDPWAEKCAASAGFLSTPGRLRRIFFLVPASVGANWFAEHVHKKALVLALQGRLSFDGKAPYPKDTMICLFGEKPGFDVWDWRRGTKGT